MKVLLSLCYSLDLEWSESRVGGLLPSRSCYWKVVEMPRGVEGNFEGSILSQLLVGWLSASGCCEGGALCSVIPLTHAVPPQHRPACATRSRVTWTWRL